MATSKVEICNLALIKIGSEPILTLSDDSQRARLCNMVYESKKKELLRSHPWHFAKKRIALSKTLDEPLFDYAYYFNLPNDCIRVLDVDLDPSEAWALEDEKRLLANTDPINILYVKDENDVTKFDDSFVQVLAWAIAMEISFSLNQSAEVSTRIENGYKESLRSARTYNAQTGSNPSVYAGEWLNARRS
jgi:hypothetical protein